MTSPSDEPIIGIDLGTTNSAVAVFRGGSAQVLPNALGDLLTPSAVAVDPRSGKRIVGRTARDLLAVNPRIGAAFFKRYMGTEETLTLNGEAVTPVELSAWVLNALRSDAERALGQSVNRVVITVPAYFDESQRLATRKAGEIAGLDVVRIVNEPTAAAIAYGLHRKEDERLFAVVDLGGGTFDVCIMELFEGALEVRSTAGISMLGGEDFTDAIRTLVLERVGLSRDDVKGEADAEAMALLYSRCEKAKRRLTDDEEAAVAVPSLAGKPAPADPVTITRADADSAWQPLLDQLVGPVRTALRGARLHSDEIDEVVLVGGATRMRPVHEMVARMLPDVPVLDTIDPDLAVVHGAAVQAALCASHEDVADLVVTDVASHTLGTSVSPEIAGQRVDGYYCPVIHRNTVLPTSRSTRLVTVFGDQTKMTIPVYEGEARRVEQNRFIGKVEVKGIPKGPPGQAVDVTFTFDLDGILGVSVTVVKTGQVFEAVFSRDGRQLSKKEEAAAAKRIAEIRKDPAEQPELADLLARADLLCRDFTGELREQLDYMIRRLEAAIASRTPKLIEEAADELRKMCDMLDQGERW